MPGGLADLLGLDPAGSDTLAVDGKRRPRLAPRQHSAAYLQAAVTGGGLTVSQLRVPGKTDGS